MQNCSITFKVGGEIITESRIREVELKRYQHVFEVFSKKRYQHYFEWQEDCCKGIMATYFG